jgi:hypothetical protein
LRALFRRRTVERDLDEDPRLRVVFRPLMLTSDITEA